MKVIKRISWRDGVRSGLRTAWSLGKVLFPVTFAVALLQHTKVIEWVVAAFTPFMQWIGLPGEAAIPLALGNLLNLYAAIGAALTMDFTVKEVFILAVMLSFSHNLLVEGVVCRKVGISLFAITAARLTMAFSTAALINVVWHGGAERAFTLARSGNETEAINGFFPVVGDAFQTAMYGTLQFALIVFAVMIGIQLLKDLRVLAFISQKMEATMGFLGIPGRGAVTMAAGLLFGIAFGAGVIIEQAREQAFSKRDLYIMLLFLSGCHAVIEDTLLFVPLGVPVWALLLLRLVVAVVLTIAVARIWRGPGMQRAAVPSDIRS
ncbi:nucleoside recognition domain-containing protein [Numidum massiliense]|uniref:nucleoside recognition domain-containing protein n=1 Tax=Numidum massiliense TaxID=1522315 RepID=UPI0006D553C7|nr:nucleoside recognition domain-containing protein [Numidum massiliense]